MRSTNLSTSFGSAALACTAPASLILTRFLFFFHSFSFISELKCRLGKGKKKLCRFILCHATSYVVALIN